MNRLKELIKEYHYSQQKIAIDIGVTRSVIANICYERSSLDAKIVLSIADQLQVSVKYFLGLSDYGIYVYIDDDVFSLSESQFILYKAHGLISYDGFKRLLNVSCNDIEFIKGNAQYIKVKSEVI